MIEDGVFDFSREVKRILDNEQDGYKKTDVVREDKEKLEQQKIKETIKQLKLKNEKLSEEIKDKQQDREQRKAFADKIFNFVIWYLLAVFLLLFFTGSSMFKFTLSESILLALLGSTAISIIGVFNLVAKYLFPPKE